MFGHGAGHGADRQRNPSPAGLARSPWPAPAGSGYLADGSAPLPTGTPEPITLADAARILRRHVGAVKSIAPARGIRVQVLPGARILYDRADCERLAAAG
jgi:hypothetical protein